MREKNKNKTLSSCCAEIWIISPKLICCAEMLRPHFNFSHVLNIEKDDASGRLSLACNSVFDYSKYQYEASQPGSHLFCSL